MYVCEGGGHILRLIWLVHTTPVHTRTVSDNNCGYSMQYICWALAQYIHSCWFVCVWGHMRPAIYKITYISVGLWPWCEVRDLLHKGLGVWLFCNLCDLQLWGSSRLWEFYTCEADYSDTILSCTLVVITAILLNSAMVVLNQSQPQIVWVHYTRVFANKYSEQYLSAHFIITIHNVSVPQNLLEEYSARHSAQNWDTMGSHIVMMKLCALKDCPDYLQI